MANITTLIYKGRSISAKDILDSIIKNEKPKSITLTKAIESNCLDINNLSDKLAKFVFSTEGLGDDIKTGAKEIVKKIIEKIKQLIEMIGNFFEGIIRWFGEKYHQYIIDNASQISLKLRQKFANAKLDREDSEYGIDSQRDSGAVYSVIIGSMKFAKWISGSGGRITEQFKRVAAIISKRPNTPEEAEQMAQEVDEAVSQFDQTMEEGKAQSASEAPKNKKEQIAVLIKSLSMNNILDKSKDLFGGLLKSSKELLSKASENLQAASSSGNSSAITLWNKVTVFFNNVIRNIMSAPLIKGIINRDKEALRNSKDSDVESNPNSQATPQPAMA
jgi:hypothetical protein